MDLSTVSDQKNTIFNLYNSGITPEIIALELDTTKEKVMQTIEEERGGIEKNKRVSLIKMTDIPFISKLYLDAVIDVESIIKDSQIRMWKALRVKLEFKISLNETQRILEKFVESKIDLVILHIDLVDSTKMSMILSIDKLSAIIRAFCSRNIFNNFDGWRICTIHWRYSFGVFCNGNG